MINDILNCVEKLKAIDKFIFLAMLFQNKPYINGSRKQLVIDFGYSESVIERTLRNLVEGGFLHKQLVPKEDGQRGRPSYQYKNVILESLNKRLNVAINLETLFSNEKIKILLNFAFGMSSFSPLKADSKLLLIVLLHHADKFGFVEGLENSTLLKLTGLKRQALEGQIQTLIDLGYICSKVSGINNKYLFGRKSSIFILNMQHVNFSGCSETTTTFLYFKHPDSLKYKPGYNLTGKQRFINFSAPGTFEAQKLILLSLEMEKLISDQSFSEDQRKLAWESLSLYPEVAQLIEYQHFKEVAMFFITKSNPQTFAIFLQYKLNQYASILISENIYQPNINNHALKTLISADILAPKLDDAINKQALFDGKLFSTENKMFLVELLYSLSLMIARDISKILSSRNLPASILPEKGDNPAKYLASSNFRILPPLRDDFRYLTIISDLPVHEDNAYFIYGDTIVKKYQHNGQLVAEEVLIKAEQGYIHKTFKYACDKDLQVAKKLLQTIESRFLEAKENLSDAQLFCFALHHRPEINYLIDDKEGWLLPPKHKTELAQ